VDQYFVVAVLVGKDGLDQFAQGIGRAGAPGGPPVLAEDDAVALLFGEGCEIGLEIWRTLQRDMEVMTQLKGLKKGSVVLQLLSNRID